MRMRQALLLKQPEGVAIPSERTVCRRSFIITRYVPEESYTYDHRVLTQWPPRADGGRPISGFRETAGGAPVEFSAPAIFWLEAVWPKAVT